ncbi:AAA family ATPase [Paenibacillus sp. ISL-20]|uniref:AAA family ATPase n=1 Tax=Paenibacillus sp. ISL-20 TaxID=2819163 RepID=UPI001BECE91E|nr:AAA family ATPase [Paenibacillus sp. ISL-20]MBT2762399.1 AAA family ATPase [Paenibacillus sp. ISL-20]
MIKSLYVNKFRALSELNVPLGKKMTVIAGQNATCKSTLLGMLGQPFGLKNEKTIFLKSFSTKFSDIFKWSSNYDIPGEHTYQIEFYDETIFGKSIEYVKSYKRSDQPRMHIRLVVGKTRTKGEGNLDYPVIYLGLKRVYPIGELNEINISLPTLTEEEIRTFNEWYKQIFFPLENVSPVQITSNLHKDTLAVNSESYDYFANSAGQDNIGQILGSILSFKRLKEEKRDSYKGGLLLIDEFDATLFPAAQINLINLLYKLAGKLKLQIVLTTHSLDALQHIIEQRKHNNGDTEVLYFTKVHGSLELISGVTMERIRRDLTMSSPGQLNPNIVEKLNVYCEDAEASWFIKKMLGSSKTKFIKICDATFGSEELKSLAKKNITEFDNSIIVLDGDAALKKTSHNIILLPSKEKMNPENLFRDFLQELPPDDTFWKNDWGYTKQVFMKELSDLTNGQYKDREKMKAWFNSQKSKKYWGYNANNLYKRWLQDHNDEVTLFTDKFVRAYNEIAKRKSIPLI